jgi:hypothetical protein
MSPMTSGRDVIWPPSGELLRWRPPAGPPPDWLPVSALAGDDGEPPDWVAMPAGTPPERYGVVDIPA